MNDASQEIEWVLVDVVDGRAVETDEVVRWKVEQRTACKSLLDGN